MTIISGGQTGVDRAAWDVALELALELGGWIPKGRSAEDGTVPLKYSGLCETESDDPAVRTTLNVRDADATLILSQGPLRGGSLLTLLTAKELDRPVLHIDLTGRSDNEAVDAVLAWLGTHRPERLNVAGPRASEDASLPERVKNILRDALLTVARPRPVRPSR